VYIWYEYLEQYVISNRLWLCLDSVPRKNVPYSVMMKNLHKRMEGLEKTLADHNISFESESGGFNEAGNNMAISPSFPTVISDHGSIFSQNESPLQSQSNVLAYDRKIMLDLFIKSRISILFHLSMNRRFVRVAQMILPHFLL
jgi:hypothetical protein